jgi:hypothetical protein
MASPAPLSNERQLLPDDVTAEDMRKLQEFALRWFPPSEEFYRVDFVFGEDWDGDPAMWLTLIAKDDLAPSKEKMERIRRGFDGLDEDVRSLGLKYWPYTKIKTV